MTEDQRLHLKKMIEVAEDLNLYDNEKSPAEISRIIKDIRRERSMKEAVMGYIPKREYGLQPEQTEVEILNSSIMDYLFRIKNEDYAISSKDESIEKLIEGVSVLMAINSMNENLVQSLSKKIEMLEG